MCNHPHIQYGSLAANTDNNFIAQVATVKYITYVNQEILCIMANAIATLHHDSHSLI